MEDVREMSGEESEMKCLFVITCIFGGKSILSLSHIQLLLMHKGLKGKKCMSFYF